MVKRAFDLLVAGLGLVIAAPLLVVIGLLVAVNLGWPVIFSQRRPGMNGQPFVLHKFRSMRIAPANEGPESDAQRLGRFGRVLRATSLDELPELWNVLRGDMSLVGPRPLLMEYLPLYSEEQARRHEVRPGITGWAQVNGRNAVDWPTRFALDVWYVDNRSFWLDLKILWLTVWHVVSQRGVNQPGEATMQPFKGNS